MSVSSDVSDERTMRADAYQRAAAKSSGAGVMSESLVSPLRRTEIPFVCRALQLSAKSLHSSLLARAGRRFRNKSWPSLRTCATTTPQSGPMFKKPPSQTGSIQLCGREACGSEKIFSQVRGEMIPLKRTRMRTRISPSSCLPFSRQYNTARAGGRDNSLQPPRSK